MWRLADEELAGQLGACEAELRAAFARMVSLVAEGESRGLASELGYRDMAMLLSETLRISPREAKGRVAAATATAPARSVTGAEVPAAMPATGQALAAGELNAEHVRELHSVMKEVSGRVEREQYADAERDLVALARQAGPAVVRKAGRHLLGYLDQDGTLGDDGERAQEQPSRSFRYHYTRSGRMRFDGHVDPETAAQLEGLFGALARPDSGAAGEQGYRPTDQRQGDAFAEIVDLATRTDEQVSQGGETAAVTVTMSLQDLQAHARAAVLHLPGVHTASGLRRVCCDARITPAVLGTRGEVLDLGRSARLASKAQRQALVVRDSGCAFPGCDRGPKWTTAHHIVHWAHGGATDQDNLLLLCTRHHRRIHHSAWQVRMRDGLPEFIPPSWLDAAQHPIRNNAHDPPVHVRAA